LRDHQYQEAADDEHEDKKLKAERCDVPLFERVVEVAVPAVEPDLSDGVRADDESEADGQQSDPISSLRKLSARNRSPVAEGMRPVSADGALCR
jgi:hypothetical protein